MEDGESGPAGDRARSLIDQHVGERLRHHRLAAGLSVASIALALGVSADDFSAWESGTCRIPPGDLLAASELLSCPLTAFFEGFPVAQAPKDEIERTERDIERLFNHYHDIKH